jgi:hypothetical protein
MTNDHSNTDIQETVGEYNSKHYGKAWYLVGVAHDGAAWCEGCAYSWPLSTVDPLFMSDSIDMACDACGELI